MMDWLTSRSVHGLAIISIAELVLLYVMLVVLQSDGKPLRLRAGYWLPFLVYTVPAYLLIAWRLSARPHDPIGLGLAMVVSAVSLLLLAGLVIWLGGALNLLGAVLMLHVTLLVLCFVFVPTQFLVAYRAGAALRTSGSYFPALMIGVAFVVCYLAAASVVWRKYPPFGTDELSQDAAYSGEVMEKFLLGLYTCMWNDAGPGARNGFPVSEDALRALGPTCWKPAIAPGGSVKGASYEFRYIPGPPDADGRVRKFALAAKSRGWEEESIYVDDSGIGRRDSWRWASAASRKIPGGTREIARILGFFDAYRELHGVYPARLTTRLEQGDGHEDDVVISPPVGARLVESRADGSFAVTGAFASFTYTPVRTNSEDKPQAYTLLIHGDRTSLWTLRSYFIDESGLVHGTGENRDATAADPLVPADEWRRMVPPQLRRAHAQVARDFLTGKTRRPDA